MPTELRLTCSKCGHPMPPLDDDAKRLLLSGMPITATHEVCPGPDGVTPDPATAAKEGRHFEVRVTVVELVPAAMDGEEAELYPTLAGTLPGPEVVEMLSFVHGETATDLDTAMRPLALGLGIKWARAEKHARLTDIPTVDGP